MMPLHDMQDISCHNLTSRQYRQGIDQVDDIVQVALRTEVQEVRRVREEMNQLLEMVRLVITWCS